MAINFSTQVYTPAFNLFARPVTITPLVSQPNAPAYAARGIYDTEPIDVLAEEGSIFSDSRVVLDILEAEFTVLPLQGDHVAISENVGMPDLGTFEVIEVKSNGGGETSLSLRKWVAAKPA
jgi:hypothetical protein